MMSIPKATTIKIDQALINKYTMRGPRYTSYPTAPEWKDSVGEAQFRQHLAENNSDDNRTPLSIYIHIPFCAERCYYCACNVIIAPNQDIGERYIDLLIKEIDLVAPHINPNRNVSQLHFGGGTPTYLRPKTFDRLLKQIYQRFTFEPDAELSVESDVRVTSEEHLTVLRENGFNRISFGVQDFSIQTQHVINRLQSAEQTGNFVRLCRELDYKSVNIDLVYGLPHQTVETFEATADTLNQIDPDRIALYNFAFLPSKLPYQRRIQEEWLPDSEERFAIFQTAIEKFTQHGLCYIGMDHFAKPTDELTIAQSEGTLQRNFMGFTTRAGSDLYSFGTSSIGSLPALYTQNGKKLKTYEDNVDAGRLPIERGLELSKDDQIRRWVIMELMCNLRVDVEEFKKTWNENFHDYFAEEIPRLQPFIQDGLVDPDLSTQLRVTELGHIIVRPVAMVFDAYLTKTKEGKSPLFSKTL
jgi:oxygen-independent coproporphyrinogen III oxidase